MSTISIILLIGGGIAVFLFVIGIVLSSSESRGLVDDRLKKYLEEEKESRGDKASKTALTDWVNRRVEKSTIGERIARDLARADLKFKPGEYYCWCGYDWLSPWGAHPPLGCYWRYHWSVSPTDVREESTVQTSCKIQ
jgi:hypothetical protein